MGLVIAEDNVTANQRNTVGKGINFGIIYGLTAHGLAQQLSIPVDHAEAVFDFCHD